VPSPRVVRPTANPAQFFSRTDSSAGRGVDAGGRWASFSATADTNGRHALVRGEEAPPGYGSSSPPINISSKSSAWGYQIIR
jgi:hypothetical protein